MHAQGDKVNARAAAPCWRRSLLATGLRLGVGAGLALAGTSALSQPKIEELLSVDALPPEFYTFSPDEHWLEPEDSYWMSFSNWVMGQQHIQSERVQSLGAWADRTLSGSPRTAPNNESYLRLGFAAESRTGKLASIKPEARFRLDAPTAEERLRVIVESESEELIPLGERRRDRQLTSDERSNTGATGALRFLSDLTETVNLSNDVGIRLRTPPDAFWRATARGRWELNEDWRLLLDQRFYFFHRDGWGESTWVGFGRQLPRNWDFMSASEAVWVHKDRQFELSHTLNFFKRIDNRNEVNPRLGVFGQSKPNWQTTGYIADMTWRRRMYADWLYGEVIPALEFPRDESFKERFSLLLRVEMFFSGELRNR